MSSKNLFLMFIVSIMGCLAIWAVPLMAGPEPGSDNQAGQFGGGTHRMERLLQHFDLTDEQQAAIETIMTDGRDEDLARRKQILQLRNELQGEMLKDEPAENRVKELVGQIGEIRIEMEQSHVSRQLAIRKELTPEQRDQFVLMKEKMHNRGCSPRAGRGRGHGHRERWDGYHGKGGMWSDEKPESSGDEL